MLILLIIIELLVMNVSLLIFLVFRLKNIEFYLVYYLVFRVCEGVLGLSLLVIIVRYSGRDLYYMFNIRKYYVKIFDDSGFYKFYNNKK